MEKKIRNGPTDTHIVSIFFFFLKNTARRYCLADFSSSAAAFSPRADIGPAIWSQRRVSPTPSFFPFKKKYIFLSPRKLGRWRSAFVESTKKYRKSLVLGSPRKADPLRLRRCPWDSEGGLALGKLLYTIEVFSADFRGRDGRKNYMWDRPTAGGGP